MLPRLLVLLVLVALGAGAAYCFWQSRYNSTKVSYMFLPPHEIPDLILVGGVVVENRGRQPAPNVKITIRFGELMGTMIHHMRVQSSDHTVLRSGGERYNYATVSARSLRPHGKIFINWAAADDLQPEIQVTTYQPTKEPILRRLLPYRDDTV
jgi:hypothetical protein